MISGLANTLPFALNELLIRGKEKPASLKKPVVSGVGDASTG
jgi:hypothetical protein